MSNVIFSIGNFSVSWYSVCILVGVVIATIVFFFYCKKYEINTEYGFNMIFWTLIFGIIGARAYYVAFEFGYYQNHISEIFQIWKGGLAIHGGIIGGLLFIIFYTNSKNLSNI